MITFITFMLVQFAAFTVGFLYEMFGWIMNLITSPLGLATNFCAEWMSELRVQMHEESLQRQLRTQANQARAKELVAKIVEGRPAATSDGQ